jgi:stage IV sporulation protein FB
MRDWSFWSVSLGRFAGVQVRLHAFFLLFALGILYLASGDIAGANAGLVGYCALALAVLLVSVLLHELAHGIAAQRVGGNVEELVLGPFGGLAPMSVPAQPQLQLIVAVAGPLVNLGLVFLSTMCLLLAGDGGDFPRSLSIDAADFSNAGAWWILAVKFLFWINWALLLANMLPAQPFDGGTVLRSILWPFVGYRRAVMIVALIAKITAGVLCIVAWFVPQVSQFEVSNNSYVYMPPLWLPIVMIALVLYFSAKAEVERLRERELSEEWLGFDFSQQFGDDDEPVEPRRRDPGIIQRWLERRRAARLRRKQLEEEEEEWRADDILARLHESGMRSLSAEDRAILQRVSMRYRNRQNH